MASRLAPSFAFFTDSTAFGSYDTGRIIQVAAVTSCKIGHVWVLAGATLPQEALLYMTN